MAATSTLSSDLQTTSGVERDSEPGLDVEVLREGTRTGLINALNSVNGSKTLVLDPSLAGPLRLVMEVTLFKRHGVDKMELLARTWTTDIDDKRGIPMQI